jgi:hypothetical protein
MPSIVRRVSSGALPRITRRPPAVGADCPTPGMLRTAASASSPPPGNARISSRVISVEDDALGRGAVARIVITSPTRTMITSDDTGSVTGS